MEFDDPYKYMISGYYGIELLDEYKDKQYLLKRIRDYINGYLEENRVDNVDYEEIKREIEKNNTEIDKLQDALILLNDINAPMEASIIIRQKISELKRNN